MIDKFLNEAVKFISSSSYWVCLYVATGGNIAYIVGFKKGIKIAVASVVIFVFISVLL